MANSDRITLVNVQEDASDSQSGIGEPKRSTSENDDRETSIPEFAPEPAWPKWTPPNDLSKQPIFPASEVYYGLVRPPTGIAPTEDGQEYVRVITSEDDLFYHEATCPPPIDIFHRPDGLAPAGVFSDHTLNTGGRILLAYRFNSMSFDGMRTGTSEVSTASVLSAFPIAPTHATFQTHYFTFEYGPTDDLTLTTTLPIIMRHINYVDRAGEPLLTDITELYDISINANYVIWRGDRQQFHVSPGIRVPAGVFDLLGQTPSPTSPALTYPMRTSDGTYDFLPGATYRGQSDYWTWGVQGLGTVRFGVNKFGYRLGNDATLNAWLSRKLTDSISASARLNAMWWGNIFEGDARLNPNLVPTNRTNLQAGDRLELLFGANYLVPNGFLQGQRVGVEGGFPLYQNLSGPQLQQKYDLWANLTIVY